MNEADKIESAVKSIQEFNAILDQIREEAYNVGYAAGVQDRDRELNK